VATAIVSLACRYPDAATPEALWQNALEGRRAFRPIPAERLDLAHYAAEIVGEADSITGIKAGLLTDWQFDCARFRIPQPAFEAADLTHWLALEVAADAIDRAGGPAVLDRDRTAVVVANTLTGEFSRAAMLRLRAPFLDEILAEAIAATGLDEAQSGSLRRRFSAALRERFPTPTEETLAGGLSNTIAGRIANYFDLRGGAYAVDAACASSLVAVADAANLLALGEVDAVLVGAVDLSLDPFELVGFSRNGALARDDMRVFDRRSSGFWPGEGAAFLLMTREQEARSRGLPVRALLRGWGVSSDGAGGLTRPTVDGQLRALSRAHEMAATEPSDIGYVEAHGTGTSVGDAIEVTALARWRNGAPGSLPIGSIKANIGHTKAAAGLAGLIKTAGALAGEYVPPHVGCLVPHPIFREIDGAVRPALQGEAWPTQQPRLAGISGFGFGGINAHVVLERNGAARRAVIVPRPYRAQDAELFVFAASGADALAAQLIEHRRRVDSLSLAELIDLAAACAGTTGAGPFRTAIVAREPGELANKLDRAIGALTAGREEIDSDNGLFVVRRSSRPRLGFLFPGQAAPSRPHGGLWARRFDWMREVIASIPCSAADDAVDTAIAQPAIAAACLVAWRLLEACGLQASIAVGHSLGELVALAWAGAVAKSDLVRLAATRGALIAAHGGANGGMLRIAAGHEQVRRLIDSLDLAIACDNGPGEIVISGSRAAIAIAGERARRGGLETTQLTVSHAFHSAMMEPAVAPFAAALAGFKIGRAERAVASTITGSLIGPSDEVRSMLVRQLVVPVQFEAALQRVAEAADLLIEVGPGSGLARLARQAGRAAVSVDACADSFFPLLSALGMAYAFGATLRLDQMFQDRSTRPFERAAPRFLASPCGRRPGNAKTVVPALDVNWGSPRTDDVESSGTASTDALKLVRDAIAEETGFIAADIGADDRFLDDLHLNSLAVSRIAAKSARLLGCTTPVIPTEFANATPRALADALTAMKQLGPQERRDPDRIPGVRLWVRPFAVRWVARERAARVTRVSQWRVLPVRTSEQDRPIIETIARRGGPPDGLLVWIGTEFDESSTHELFVACRAAWADGDIARLAICHAGSPVSAFARSLAAEERFQSVVVIERPRLGISTERILEALDAAEDDFVEVRIEQDGSRSLPEFALAHPTFDRSAAITGDDVILVTGGAKGVGAECALRIAARAGAALILAGRSRSDDPAVIATLGRAEALNLRCRYASADVCDTAALSAAVAAAAAEVGPVTALVHAAGMNDPTLFQQISDANLHQVLAPKTRGLRAAIAACGPRLRRIVAFGSILGRMGLKGEAHYAIANAWQSLIAEQFARKDCHVLSLEWSLWSGVGMGHRLGSLERLARFGVDALPIEAALEVFESLLLKGAVGTFMVTSRFGPPRHVSLGAPELPILRFLDKPLLHYPGVEVVVETELSGGRDLYAADHRIGGAMVFPAVLGLEAMAQVATALAAGGTPVAIEAVAFPQAVVIPDDGVTRIRIMALADEGGRIEVAIRAEDDAFAVERMRATIVFDSVARSANGAALPGAAQPAAVRSVVSLDALPLYGPLFFQGERFRRVRWFSHVSARRIAATLSPRCAVDWFSSFEAQQLVLGNPGARDALLHALQAAVPHRRVIPVSVDRFGLHGGGHPVRLEAVERDATEDRFVFDILARDAAGAVVESWEGVTFRAISYVDDAGKVVASVPALAAAYVERIARAALREDSIEVALVFGRQLAREERRGRAIAALGLDGRVFTRSDGKPFLVGCDPQLSLSIAHRDGVTLAVKALGNIGCDIEAVADWSAATSSSSSPLSPSAQALAAELAADVEPLAVAAARVWGVYETALKQTQLSERCWKTDRRGRDGVVLFETASARTATMRVPSSEGEFVISVGLCTAEPVVPAIGAAASDQRIGWR
jgi:enediyne polyketide synthase